MEDLINSGGSDDRWGIRTLIGGTYAPFSQAGGVAFIGSFNWDTDTPALVFEDNLADGHEKATSEAISHEVGHSLFLLHDGRRILAKNTIKDTVLCETSWAPIRGLATTPKLSSGAEESTRIPAIEKMICR